MNKFRLLRADEIECRVSQINDKGLSLLLYKTARTDANLLDEVIGFGMWQNDFKLVDGVLYGGIGIIFADMNGEWVWKWDAGTESNTEAEKGRASDAFKRAGFKWGIGRELYTAPFIWIGADKCNIKEDKRGKLVCFDLFSVGMIEYNANQEISALTIINEDTRKTVFSWGAGKAVPKPSEEKEATPEAPNGTGNDFVPTCKDCGKKISDAEHDYSVKYYGIPLCRQHQKEHQRIK